MTAPGPGHSSAPRDAHAVCGGINSRVISHRREGCPADRLFAVIYYEGAPAQQRGPTGVTIAGSLRLALSTWTPLPHPYHGLSHCPITCPCSPPSPEEGLGCNSWGPQLLPRPAPLIFMESLLSAGLCLW